MKITETEAKAALEEAATTPPEGAFGPGKNFLWVEGKLLHAEMVEQETGNFFPGWVVVEGQ